MERIKYITNKELLAEIDRSKRTYSYYTKPEYARFDLIVHDIDLITPELIASTLTRRLEIVAKQGPAIWGDALANGITEEDIVFRVMTNAHIPFDPNRKRRSKVPTDEGQAKTPFPPFKHYVVINGDPVEVARSHWKGDLQTGAFCLEHGKITNRLATMFMLLVERYSKRGNWRGYCFDSTTEIMTQRGWLGIADVNDKDIVLSCDVGQLKWSQIKSIFRSDFDGKMFKLDVAGMDALVTPGHKFATMEGLKRVEYLTDDDVLVVSGNGITDFESQFHTVMVKDIDFHGGKRTGDFLNPNEPTFDYHGKVWCPETEYGTVVARRNNTIYVTGQTYVDEMRNHALLQLSQIGLQFDEFKSDNPFAFYTQVIKNCLAGDTLVLTREYGSVPIADISEQDVTLLDGNGDWVMCHIYDHGVQETQLIQFQGGDQRIGIRSTLNHGWVSNGVIVETKDFVEKNTKIDDLRPAKTVKDNESYRNGVVHGLIYGDGHRGYETRKGSTFFFTLCSHDASIIPYVEQYPYSMSGDYPRYRISEAWANLKAFPEVPGADLDYLLGFFRGWFAADGCVSKVPTPTLCGDPAEHAWLKQWGPLVGWHVNGFTKLAEKTNFGKRIKESCNFHLRKSSMDADDFLIEQHRERWEQRPVTRKGKSHGNRYDWDAIERLRAEGMKWVDIAKHFLTKSTSLLSSYSQYKKARDFKENPQRQWVVYCGREQTYERRFERVYCPVVETTHSFALGVGIHSLNCFTRILNVERKNQHIRDDLLIIAGVQPSYTRQIDHEIEQRFADDHATNNPGEPVPSKVVELPKKRGRKPKAQLQQQQSEESD